MAGRGSRLRPHTLTVPKPLVPVAGKPIVQRLVEDLTRSLPEKVEEIAFIIGDFGPGTEQTLARIADGVGAKASVYTQDDPLGTAHAILCAAPSLSGPCIVAFADTLFNADFSIDPSEDGFIWVQKVADPSAFGVVQLDENGYIAEFVEKSPVFVSDLAIVGIYYFKDGGYLKEELQYLIDNNIKDKGEFQLTNALENMKAKGTQFRPAPIDEWLDCGNKQAVVTANQRMLELKYPDSHISETATLENALILPPCYIGEQAEIRNAVVGPHVSVGNHSKVENSLLSNCVIQDNTHLQGVILKDSMVGNFVELEGCPQDISVGDFTKARL